MKKALLASETQSSSWQSAWQPLKPYTHLGPLSDAVGHTKKAWACVVWAVIVSYWLQLDFFLACGKLFGLSRLAASPTPHPSILIPGNILKPHTIEDGLFTILLEFFFFYNYIIFFVHKSKKWMKKIKKLTVEKVTFSNIYLLIFGR